jgi:hypothetical protein
MFEIHITVNTQNIDKFKTDCNSIGVKPIVIDLQDNNENSIMMDVMTSSKHRCPNYKLISSYLKNKLINLNYDIKRVKVEVNPFYYNIKNVTGELYYESHVRVIANNYNKDNLKVICKNNGYHLSKNVFKKIDDDNFYIMSTIRCYNTDLETFKNKIDNFISEINGFNYDKIEIECCIYDTNINHDSDWLKKKG